jgi:hypothetical protein
MGAGRLADPKLSVEVGVSLLPGIPLSLPPVLEPTVFSTLMVAAGVARLES